MTTTTWDPNAKSAGTTLSGGNLTATITSGGSNVAATRVCTGPTYFEVTIGASVTGTIAIGLCNRSLNFASGNLIGVDANGVGYRNNGTVLINSVTVATIATYLATQVICVAFSPQYQLIWFRVGSGGWNNDVIGNQNPVGNVGGISTATMSQGSMLPAMGATTVTPNQSGTAVFTSGFAQTAPTGYITVDTSAATATNSATPKGATYSTVGPTTNNAVTTSIAARASMLGMGTTRAFTPAGTLLTVTGTVKVSGSAIPGKTVFCHDRRSGELLGTAITDGSGAYSLSAVGRSSVRVVAADPTTYNDLIYDNVVPI